MFRILIIYYLSPNCVSLKYRLVTIGTTKYPHCPSLASHLLEKDAPTHLKEPDRYISETKLETRRKTKRRKLPNSQNLSFAIPWPNFNNWRNSRESIKIPTNMCFRNDPHNFAQYAKLIKFLLIGTNSFGCLVGCNRLAASACRTAASSCRPAASACRSDASPSRSDASARRFCHVGKYTCGCL